MRGERGKELRMTSGIGQERKWSKGGKGPERTACTRASKSLTASIMSLICSTKREMTLASVSACAAYRCVSPRLAWALEGGVDERDAPRDEKAWKN